MPEDKMGASLPDRRRARRSARIKVYALFALLGLLVLSSFGRAKAQTPSPTPLPTPTAAPTLAAQPGFYLIDSARGVQLYKKDYANGNPDYVQLIDLSQGARLELKYGQITEPRPEKGVYGGADPRMTSLPIQTYWEQSKQEDPNAFCATNGQFFYMPEYPTRLAFPLKVNGQMVTDGWGIDTYVDQKLMLELWDDHAAIRELTPEALAGSGAPNLIAGLTEEANKRAKYSVGRTFLGVADRDGDGLDETVLVFNTASAKEEDAAETLRSFGADQVMMLDGGGSTQLICKSGWHIRSDRPIPQAIAIYAAALPPVDSLIVSHSDWPVIVEGDRLPLEIEIQNTGTFSWTPATSAFVLQADRLEFQEKKAVATAVPPGATTTLTQTITLFRQSGVMPIEVKLGIRYRGKLYAEKTLDMQAVVLPYQLRSQAPELEKELAIWRAGPPGEVADLANAWIRTQMQAQTPVLEINSAEQVEQVRPIDVTILPLLMLPFMALIAWAIAHTRR
jgi:hypothetical protein